MKTACTLTPSPKRNYSAPSHFAPAKRADGDVLKREVRVISSDGILRDLYNSVIESVVVLNGFRQIVFANDAFLRSFGADPAIIHGRRTGEVMQCVNADKSSGGCGTTEYCRHCGAAQAILNSQNGHSDLKECRILRKERGEALDLLIKTNPLSLSGRSFTVMAIQDISDEKRRRALEAIFFHDILNTACGIRGITEIIEEADEEDRREFNKMLGESANILVGEIQAQRQLSDVENNTLDVEWTTVDPLDLMEKVQSVFRHHQVGRNKSIKVLPPSRPLTLETDPQILSRILGNMLKNALEAIAPGETVTLGCHSHLGNIRFNVHNPGLMPEESRMQVFQRSFSTKGKSRGLGAYSMKLLSERCLGGRVGFTSESGTGTTFWAEYPASSKSEEPGT